MKIAVLDCGTNTFNLVIVEKTKNGFRKLSKNKIAVKLGQGGLANDFISKDAYERGLKAIENHVDFLNKNMPEKVYAFATSGIRSTRNGQQFVNEVKEKYNLEIEVIDGDAEANYIYHGVKLSHDIGSERKLLMDIGGGSTEFIIANKDTIFWKKSFKLGVSRLKEMFNPSDPIKDDEVLSLTAHFDLELEPLALALKNYPCSELIGSSGSFDTLAYIVSHKFYDNNHLKNKTHYSFKLKELESSLNNLIDSKLEQRLNTKGLLEMRVDMIVIAAVFIKYIKQRFEFKKISQSKYSLKEGVISEILKLS